MYLKEIFNESNKNLNEFYGIQLDEESMDLKYSSTPPENLETIGFILKLDEENSIHTDLIDVMINYKLTNLTVILEVPCDLISKGFIKTKEIIQLANNLDVALSILPPNHQLVSNEVSIQDYCNIISEVIDFMIEKPNFDKFIVPVSNFMEYLMIETILGENSTIVSQFAPKDEYIVNNFSSILSKEDSDLFKSIIRNKLYDLYGGKENFNVVAETIFNSIKEQSESFFKQHVINHLEQQNK